MSGCFVIGPIGILEGDSPEARSSSEYFHKKDGYRQLNVRQLGSLRPWDYRGKYYMDRKRIQCLSNASQHVPIYLQPFRSNSSREFKSSPF